MVMVRSPSELRHLRDCGGGRTAWLVGMDVAAHGIHVQDIAHVINHDLPEAAEKFIHCVGRTGRAGERGVASTLFVNEQRPDVFQLARALGIRTERVSMNADSFYKTARPSTSHPS